MVFLEVEMQGSTLIPSNQLVRRSSQGRNPSLSVKLCHQKVIQWAWVFRCYHFLNKIGEGRIRDLTGDVPFLLTFKCAMLIVIRKDPRPYWCIMSNNVLMYIENRADLPHPRTEGLTPQMVVNRTNWSFHVYLNERGIDTGTSINDIATTYKKEKNLKVKFLQRQKTWIQKHRRGSNVMNSRRESYTRISWT